MIFKYFGDREVDASRCFGSNFIGVCGTSYNPAAALSAAATPSTPELN
jgi:hypothetical protein